MTDDSKPKKRKKKRWVLRIFIALLVLVGILHFPVGRVEIEVGPDTTLIEGPLNDDGTVNYVAALDAAYSEGVTRDNNAAYLLLEAMGPEMLDEESGGKALRRLGVTHRAGAKYYTGYEKWATDHSDALGEGPLNSPEDFRVSDVGPSGFELLMEGKQFAPAGAWLEYNAAALDLIVAASRKPLLYVPVVSDDEPPVLYAAHCWGLTGLTSAGQALVARAMIKLNRGEVESAWSDIMAVHRLARLMSRSPLLITQLVAIAVDVQAVRGGAALAERGKLTGAQARAMGADLAALAPVGDVVGQIERTERYALLDGIMFMSRGAGMQAGAGLPAFMTSGLDWNEMCRVVNYWWDGYSDAIRKPTPAERAVACEEWEKTFMDMKENSSGRAGLILLKAGGWPCRRHFSRQVAELLVGILMPVLGSIVESQEEARLRTRLTGLAFAVAAYKAENARWPASLGDLAPKYVASIPQDVFAQKPLTYKVRGEGYVIYSVGVNGTDDGGVKDDDEKDDIAVEVK